MSRNSMHTFGLNPSVSIPRSKFDLDCDIKFTGNTGDLIPFYCLEVLPGDTFEVKTSLVCRLQTLIHPIMDTMYLDTYYFFVPNRLVWDHWKNFCGEPDKAWLPENEYTIPKIACVLTDYCEAAFPDYSFKFNDLAADFKDTIFDYLGMPLSPTMETVLDGWNGSSERGFYINSLPIRAYNKIYDDWFRDENLIDPINLYTGDNAVKWDPSDPLTGGKCYKAAKYHDYFTSCLPQAQRGNPVSLSADTRGLGHIGIPVYTMSLDHELNGGWEANQTYLHYGTSENSNLYGQSQNSNNYTRVQKALSSYAPSNLWAGWSDNANLPLGITINDLRLAFQVQKFMEKSARGGARYIELLKEMFGVTSPDARLQRSEYLGGHRIPITIHQIVNQTETIDTPLGNTGAMSLTSDSHQDFIHSFTEHGYIIGLCVARYKHSYSQGYYRMYDRTRKFDFYWPVFANIGEQGIKNRTLCYTYGNESDIFGYQEAWAEYRTMFDRVAGEMRPGIPNTLASWHLGDYYTELPTLSKSWIEEDIAPVDRAIAVTSAVADQFLFDIYIQNRATRPMPVYSIPGLADHH